MNILQILPEELFAKVMLFHSHPVADLFKMAVETVNEELYEIIPGDYEYGGEDFCKADDKSFADNFFNGSEGIAKSRHIYHYAFIDATYLITLSEYLRSSWRLISTHS